MITIHKTLFPKSKNLPKIVEDEANILIEKWNSEYDVDVVYISPYNYQAIVSTGKQTVLVDISGPRKDRWFPTIHSITEDRRMIFNSYANFNEWEDMKIEIQNLKS
jgi:hypothetical protein